MSRCSQTYESDLLLLLLRSPAPDVDDDNPIRTAASSAAALVDCLPAGAGQEEEEEEEEAVDPLLHSPLTEDASLVVAMFEREAPQLCGTDVGAAGNSSAVVQVEEEAVQVAIREGEELECHSEDVEIKCREAREDEKYFTARRTRSAEVHNRCERRRRGRINQRFKALQELVPRCNDKSDKASILDETIVYMKSLQQQLQIMSGGCGITRTMFPAIQTCVPPDAAIGMNNIGQPVPSSGEASAGGGGCPAYSASLPYGHFWRGPSVAAGPSGHQPAAAASWPLFPETFQSMAMANFQQCYKVPSASSIKICCRLEAHHSMALSFSAFTNTLLVTAFSTLCAPLYVLSY